MSGAGTARGDAVGSVRDQAKVKTGSRDITKAVLASPLVIPWLVVSSLVVKHKQQADFRPNIPRNHQMAVMKELPRLVPDEIAAYHTSRARCQVERKKATRKRARLAKAAEDVEMAVEPENDPAQENTTLENPVKPEILDHMVLGINETIKSLETAIDELKLRLLTIADQLNGIHLKPNSNLLPTAPPERSPSPPSSSPVERSPPAFIIIPLQSISPQTLVSPIPQYAATYNSLVWQWGQLSRIAKTRVKESEWTEVVGEEREEIRVVPLGRVEGEMAALVGLRRLACLAIRVRLISSRRVPMLIDSNLIPSCHCLRKSCQNQYSTRLGTLSHYHIRHQTSKSIMIRLRRSR